MSKLPTSYPGLDAAESSLKPLMRAITQMFQRIAVAFNNPDNGTTAERPPTQLTVGQFYFDTTLGQPVWWDGLAWVDSGTLTPPGGAANSVQYNNAGSFGGLTLADGQLLIGDTGGVPVPATLTAGTNVTITNGPGSILIDVSGSTPPGGAPNDIQFNNAGAFGGLTLDDGELLIGDTGGSPIAATLTGTANRLSVANGAGSITLNIDTAYVGQSSITTLGTVTTGVWNGTVVGEAFGGTGESTYTNGQLLIGNTGTGGLDKATLTAGASIAITNAAGAITIAQIVAAIAQSARANVVGTTSTVGVMAGLAGSITPAKSGTIVLFAYGSMSNNTATRGTFVDIRYGTGAAPVQGAALTGTLTNHGTFHNTAAANLTVPFMCITIITGLSVGTTYWIDLDYGALVGGTALLWGVSVGGIEL